MVAGRFAPWWRLARVSLLAAAVIAGAGCGPAPVRLRNRPTQGVGFPLAGEYEAKVTAPYAGTFTGRVTAEPTRSGFRANTRPGAAWPLIGGVQGLLGPIFMPYLFPSGVILTWTSTLPDGQSPGEGWLGPGGMRRYGVRTLMDAPDSPVRLVLPDGRAIALMTLRPVSEEGPRADYESVADRIEESMRTRLFVASGGEKMREGLEDYLEQVHTVARLAKDDVEFAFGAVMAARRHLKFFPVTLREMDPEAAAMLASWPEADRSTTSWSYDEKTDIGTVKVEVFLDVADVDRAMEQVLERSPRALIIDLRSCPGVELSALRLLSWLADEPVDAGTFHGPGGTDGARELVMRAASDFDDAGAALDAAAAIHAVVEPAAAPFTGPVAILTSRRTGSSAEAVVSIAQSMGRAKIIGEPTAGRVVLARPVNLGQGWVLRMPGAGWVGPAGSVVGPKGVQPDVRSTATAAATRAAEVLGE
jgi:hypothetical protein